MSRNHRGMRDRDGGRRNFGGHDGLLGEGPGGGGNMFDPSPMINSQVNQLMLAQQLLQKQAALSAGLGIGGGGDLSALAGAMNMQMMQQQQFQHAMGGGFGGMHGGGSGGGDHRKRVGALQDRDMDSKRRRRDSYGRSGDHDRFHGRDNNRGDGRDRVRSSRWEPDDRQKSKKSGDDYDPAEPTEDDNEGEGKESNRYCHVCNVSVYDDASFRRHLNGTKHQARMNSVLSVHQMKSSQLQSRLKAEEHLRKIEGKAGGGFDPDYFCKMCNNELTIPWERHRFSSIHKQRQLQVKRGCGWCGVHDFNNFTDVLEHRETDTHKKNAELYGKKKDAPESSSKKQEKKEEEEDLTIPEFNAENPVGQIYIVPVTGFFCKLCHKFYNNEKSAKGAHCQSETHYEKFKAVMETKIAAKAKREEEEAAAAAAAAAEAESQKMEVDQDEEKAAEETDGNKEEAADGKVEDVTAQEDFDDELPLTDSDDEGGLVKFIAAGNGEEKDVTLDDSQEPDDDTQEPGAEETSILEETAADASFTYLSGEAAQKAVDQNWEDIEPNVDNSQEDIAGVIDLDENTEALASAVEARTPSMSPTEDETKEEDSTISATSATNLVPDEEMVGEGSELSQEEPAAEEPTITASGGRGRGRASARRARGKARGKK